MKYSAPKTRMVYIKKKKKKKRKLANRMAHMPNPQLDRCILMIIIDIKLMTLPVRNTTALYG
jgi:hypothetical protein